MRSRVVLALPLALLTLARGYLGKLIGNKAVFRFLSQRQPDVLAEFENIVQTVTLDGK